MSYWDRLMYDSATALRKQAEEKAKARDELRREIQRLLPLTEGGDVRAMSRVLCPGERAGCGALYN